MMDAYVTKGLAVRSETFGAKGRCSHLLPVARCALVALALAAIALAAPRPALAEDATYELTLDANGGTFASDAAGETGEFTDSPLNSVLRKTYAALANLDRPTRPYLYFNGWSTSARAINAQPQLPFGTTAAAAAALPSGREHTCLQDYTIQELMAVSSYLSDLYKSVAGNKSDPLYTADKVYQEFHGYLLSTDDAYATWEPRGDQGEILTLTDGNHIQLRVVGINHDDRAFEGKKAGLTFMMTHRLPDTYNMYMNLSNSNRWDTSDMRKTYLGNNGTATATATATVWKLLPTELADAIVPVSKPIGNGNATVDLLWLPSYVELTGTTSEGATEGEGEGYEWFTSGSTASKQAALTYRYKETSSTSGTQSWTRSYVYSGRCGSTFFYVLYLGSLNSNDYPYSRKYVAFGFCL